MKRIAISLLLISLLFLSGCVGSGTNETSSINFRTGNTALEMRILNGAGQRVFEGDSLSILMELHNRGTSDISGGVIFLKGFDPRYLTHLFVEPTNIINIEGKDEFDPTGELAYTVEIADHNVKAPQHKEILRQPIQIIACYPYVSHGSYEVCIDPDPYNRRVDSKVCSYTEVNPGAQGHPVAVTSIEEKISKTDVRFNLRISNVGDGTVYDRRLSPEACAYDLQQKDLNAIYIRRVEFSGMTLRCSPQNPIRILNGGSALVSCICENCLNIDQGAYKTVLNVDLEYGYRNDLETYVEILKD